MDVPTLTDGEVTLRALGEQDLFGCLEQCIDPLSVQWTTVPVPFTIEDARRFCLEIAPGAWADGSQWIFAVDVGGRYGGNIALRDEGYGRAEVAYGSHPAVRGTGAMTRAVRLLLEWGFAEQGVQVALWRALVGNWSSRRLAWRLGFSHDGLLRGSHQHRGQLVDAWHGSLQRGEPMEPRRRWLVPPVLEADGLRLRPLADRDVPRVVEACSEERTQHWLGQLPRPYTSQDARAWIESCREGQAVGSKVTWAVVDPATDLMLGAVNVFDVTDTEGEVGYWVHPEARGRGVASSAVALVSRYALEGLGLRRLDALAAVANTASRHVIEANGFRLVGTETEATRLRTGLADVARYERAVADGSSAGTPAASAASAASAVR